MRIVIKNGRIIDPAHTIDDHGDIIIEDGVIRSITLHRGDPEETEGDTGADRVIDASGMYVLPGLVDMHVHLREPGFEHKETIKTGTLAAVRGGFTSVCSMPNTRPVNDNETVTEFILRKAQADGACHVFPIGAITKGQKGEELAEMGMMYEAGCVAFSDDGMPVMNSLIMRRALEYSKRFRLPIISHAEDRTLSAGGVMNEGSVSYQLGLKGIPREAEIIMIRRDIELARLTGGRLHIAHVSTAEGVEAIREAKRDGLDLTAETCPHYFTLTDEAVRGYRTVAKVNPPLRTAHDVEAVKEAIADGTIDVIATDHAPHHMDEKLCEFDKAAFGISGLETALSISLRLVREGLIDISCLVEKMATNPARILNLKKGELQEGGDADITVVDPEKDWRVDAERFLSKGKNTPFEGFHLQGRPVVTICKGKVYDFSEIESGRLNV